MCPSRSNWNELIDELFNSESGAIIPVTQDELNSLNSRAAQMNNLEYQAGLQVYRPYSGLRLGDLQGFDEACPPLETEKDVEANVKRLREVWLRRPIAR